MGITNAELARRVGVPRSTVTGWIKQTHKPNLESLVKLAAALGCDVADLLEAS